MELNPGFYIQIPGDGDQAPGFGKSLRQEHRQVPSSTESNEVEFGMSIVSHNSVQGLGQAVDNFLGVARCCPVIGGTGPAR